MKTRSEARPTAPGTDRADPLPFNFEYAVPDTPQPRREALRTLDDWELWLRWEVRRFELLGELDLTESEYRSLTHLVSDLVRRAGSKKVARELALHYPVALCAFLVAHGTYGFREGDFWGGIRRQTGADGGSDWGRVFESTMTGLGLSRFPGLAGYRFVTPILVHGGIPDYCLPDFFRSVVWPSVTRPRYEVLDAQDLVDALLDRAEVKFFTDKPVLHFLEHGGKIGLDFLERCRTMANAYVDAGVTPEPESVGLPGRVVAAFEEWASSQETIDRVRNTGEHVRLRRPRVVLDPWADGVVLAFPRQDMPASFLNRKLHCTAMDGETQIAAFGLRFRYIGGELHTDEVRRRLPKAVESLTVALVDGMEPVRRWNLRLGGASIPLLAFDPSNGEHIAWDTTLPADRLWLLHPADWKGDEKVPCLERFEAMPGGWSAYSGGEYDLRGLDRIRLSHDEAEHEILLTRTELGQRPRLLGGTVFQHDAELRESPLFVGSPPSLYLPLGRTDLGFEEQLGRWKLRLSSIDSASPDIERRLGLREVASAIRQEGQGMLLDLSHSRLLGPSPAGSYRLLVQGPLGLDAEFRLRVWPDLRTEGLRSLYLPDEHESAFIDFRLGVPQGCLVERQAGSESTAVSKASLDSFGIAWHDIRVLEQDLEAHLELVQFAEGEQEARLRLSVLVPWLRWSFQGHGDGAEAQGWTTRPVRLSMDPLLSAESDEGVLVDLPPQGKETLRMGLSLWDEKNRLIQQGKLQASRDPTRRTWRLLLGEFKDTLRQDSSSSFRFGLVLAGLAEHEKETHVLTVVRCATASDASLHRVSEGENEVWSLQWSEARRIQDQHVRLWNAWQPWKAPLDLALPDDASHELTFTLPRGVLGEGRLLAEFFVQDPWVSSSDHAETAWGCRVPTLALDLVPPEERLREVEALLSDDPSDFKLHYERACILTGLGREDERSDSSWCIEHLALAEPSIALSLWAWLSERGAHEECQRLSQAMAEPVMAHRMAELKGGCAGHAYLWKRYLGIVRSVGDMPLLTAKILVAVREDTAWAQAARTLMLAEDATGFTAVIDRLRDHELAPNDALLLLSANADFSARMLEALWPEPLALSLLRKLSPSQVIDRGHWIRTKAGWGQILEILDQSGEPGKCFLEGTARPRLQVVLRKGEKGKEELAEVDLQEDTIDFAEINKLWFCGKCRAFFSVNPHWIAGAHDAAAHGGMGAHVCPLGGTKTAAGCVRYDARRPRRIWE
jgi:hypothetical protein